MYEIIVSEVTKNIVLKIFVFIRKKFTKSGTNFELFLNKMNKTLFSRNPKTVLVFKKNFYFSIPK